MARLVVTGVQKSFGPTAALSGVDLTAQAGEVHAVLGENGAGKSTLMGILAGAITPDQGSLALDGAPFRPRNPIEARRAGVAIVHQELSLCPHLTVADNVLLGLEPARMGLLLRRQAEARVAEVFEQLGAPIAPDTRVSELGPAARQLVEIARAIEQSNGRVLILDEPTSSLASDDVDRLFKLVRGLRARGVTILYISHFLEEVRAIADTFTVLRDGKSVGSGRVDPRGLDSAVYRNAGERPPELGFPAEGASLSEIVQLMAGRPVDQLFERTERQPGEVVLTIDGLAGKDKPIDASLVLRRGEVLGIAGLVGAGRTELLRAVFGLDPVRRGQVRVGAYVGPASPARRLGQGVGLLTEDRKGEGLALGMSIADNLTLSKLQGFGPAGLIFSGRQRQAAQGWISRLGIRCRDPGQRAADLSGGNQQKLALARLLHHDVDVLLLDEPTRGIDIGSRAQIHRLIDAEACAGKAVLMVSSYLPELHGVCDRIAVMRRGKLGPTRPVKELSERSILMEATGV